MHRRLWLSVAMLAAGASLLVAANFASAAGKSASLKNGGTWKFALAGPGDTMDPQTAYLTTTWWLQYATAAKLFNYPDKSGLRGLKLVPEVASRYTVSRDGRTYTIFVRKGFRFSDGKPVTANNFVYAYKRVLKVQPQSGGLSFVTDTHATYVKSWRAIGKYKLVIKLRKASGQFLSQLAMPFFQATSTKLPLKKEVPQPKHLNQIPTAGPYTIRTNDVNRQTTIVQNKYWKRGPGRNRPRHLSSLTVYWNQQSQQAYLQTLSNQFDEAYPPPEQVGSAYKKFGKNKSRFWVEPQVCTGHIPLNNSRGIFKGNTTLRKAMNYGLARKDYVNQRGLFGGGAWSDLLPPGMPGYTTKQIWPFTPKLAKARSLAKGHMKNGQINVWYRSSGVVGPAQKLIINRDLIRLGFKPNNINYKPFPGSDIYDAIGNRSADFDMALSVGWCQDYPDPYDFINKLLDGRLIQDSLNDNWSYFNNAKYNRKMDAVAPLVGAKRFAAYRALSLDINKNAAPWAAMNTYNNVYILSSHVNPKSLVYQGAYQDWDINAMAKK
jgi:peptide/nickel transport system substrate-binding protein